MGNINYKDLFSSHSCFHGCSPDYCHGGPRQTHVHEFQGSTMMAEECGKPHNHRFAGITGEAICMADGNHRHEVFSYTDFFANHYHEFERLTGPAIDVGNGKHIHFVRLKTSKNHGHFHYAQFATLIENPLL